MNSFSYFFVVASVLFLEDEAVETLTGSVLRATWKHLGQQKHSKVYMSVPHL